MMVVGAAAATGCDHQEKGAPSDMAVLDLAVLDLAGTARPGVMCSGKVCGPTEFCVAFHSGAPPFDLGPVLPGCVPMPECVASPTCECFVRSSCHQATCIVRSDEVDCTSW